MGTPITEITIVGGGTAGWLTATLLNAILSAREGRGLVQLTVIESPDIASVGVGEATVPGMPRTLKSAGIAERDFIKTCNASFKLGVLFENWNVDADGRHVDFINPFARVPTIDGIDAGYYMLRHGAGDLDFVQTYSLAADLARTGKGPRPLGAPDYAPEVGFAYHLDAGRFATMLRDICKARNVRHIEQNVTGVEQDERGHISALHLQDTGRHEVQMVIDCTGFRGLIINGELGEPFISYSKYLANDRALAVQVPHRDGARIDSVTRSTALGAGWSWRVPLWNRIGTGYVFSSAHRTDDEAIDEFLAHLGPDGKGAEPRVIPMRVGRTRNAWVGNCVAIGLSGGFIEPLESTAIHMIDTMVRWLAVYLPDSDFPAPLRDRFNRNVNRLYDEIRDFICLHYALGNRTDDAYWHDARALEKPDSLAANLELWQHTLPGPYDLDFASFFTHGVYQTVLLGKRVYETGYGHPSLTDTLPLKADRWQGYLRQVRARADEMMGRMADHKSLLAEMRGETLSPPPKAKAPAFGATFGFGDGPSPTVGLPGGQFVAPKLVFPSADPASKPSPDDGDASLL